MKFRLTILILSLLSLTSCFKDENQGTLFKIEVFSQNVSSDPVTRTETEMLSYAFTVDKGSKWEVTSWDDAQVPCITNTENNKRLSEPEVIGTWDAESEYQISLDLKAETVFMVIVDPTNRIYATRLYDTPVNWPVTHTTLHLYAWRKSGTANGWTVTNPFPDEERESLVPKEDDDTVEQKNNEELE